MLEELVAKVPPPAGRSRRPGARADLRLRVRPVPRRVAYIRVVDGVFRKGEAIRAMAAGTEADIDDIGFFTPAMTPVERALAPARSAT